MSRPKPATSSQLNELEGSLLRKWITPSEDLTEIDWYALQAAIQRRTADDDAPPVELLKAAKTQIAESPLGVCDTPAWLEWRCSHPNKGFGRSPAIATQQAIPQPSHPTAPTAVPSGSDKHPIKIEDVETPTATPADLNTKLDDPPPVDNKRKAEVESWTEEPNKKLHRHSTVEQRATAENLSGAASTRAVPATSSETIPESSSASSTDEEEWPDYEGDPLGKWQHSYEELDQEELQQVQQTIFEQIRHKPTFELLRSSQNGSRFDSLDSKGWVMWRFGHHLNERIRRLNRRRRNAFEVRKMFKMLLDLENDDVLFFIITLLQMVPAEHTDFIKDAANSSWDANKKSFESFFG